MAVNVCLQPFFNHLTQIARGESKENYEGIGLPLGIERVIWIGS